MVSQNITEFLHSTLPKLNIAVVGDVMVDRYVFGDVSRISPEAPVPVNRVTNVKEVLGGAANVASNLANLECQVHLAGVAGDDEHWMMLKKLLIENRISIEGILQSKERSTTTKMRILGDRQQMLRLDFEEVKPVVNEEEVFFVNWLTKLCERGLDGLVVSDYGKGVCTPTLIAKLIAIAKTYNVPIIVDPKGKDWHKYEGATFITPNVKELSECVGYTVPNTNDDIVLAAHQIIDTYDIEYVVATRSAEGITVVNRAGNVWHSEATKQDVFDVSGAGDTVVASFITSIAGKLSMRAALFVSNAAAGIVVSKVGTYPIHRSELVTLCEQLQSRKIKTDALYSREEMVALVKKWQKNGDRVIFTNGCFDILHRGHVAYLQEAARLGDRFIIGVNTDASVKRLKGETRPIVSEKDRAYVLLALGCVDGVVLFEEDTPAELLEAIRPNVLVKGGDYKVEDVIGKEFVDTVEILPFVDGYSTTGIVERIATLVKEGKL